ncbi:MAG: pitrilysin family protein [Aquificaceae bacterium]
MRALLGVLIMALGLAQGVVQYRLSSGATLSVKQRPDSPAVAVQVWVGVGSLAEGINQKGMAHFLEHMLFNGSEGYAQGEIDQIVESMGGSINAGTSKDFTYYHITIAKPYWKDALRLIYHLTQKPLLKEEAIEKEKPIVLEEIKRKDDDPRNKLWEELEKQVYKISPYRDPILGFERTVSAFTQQDLIEFFKNYYAPQAVNIVVVGDVDPEEVYQLAENTFGKEEKRQLKKPKASKEPQQLENRSKLVQDSRLSNAYWAIAWRVPGIKSHEYPALIVLDQILGTGRTSVLFREVRERGFASLVSSGDFSRPEDNIFYIFASTSPDRVDSLRERVFSLLNNPESIITKEAVESAKRRLINSRAFEHERVQSEAFSIGYNLTVGKSLNLYLHYDNSIMSVTKEDVLNVLNKYIVAKPYSEVILSPQR